MKKINSMLLSLLILIMLMATPNCAKAASNDSVTYLDDGSYIVTTITKEPTLQPLPGAQTNAAITSATRTKSKTYFNESHEALWCLKVTGSFTYTKDSATCHSSSVKAESYNSCWKLSKASAARSGATAYASVTAKHYMANFLLNTIDELISLTCHPGGTFS